MSSDSKASAFSYFDPKDNDNLEGHPGSSLGFGDVQNFGDEPGEDPFPFHGSGETSGEGFLNLLQQIEPENVLSYADINHTDITAPTSSSIPQSSMVQRTQKQGPARPTPYSASRVTSRYSVELDSVPPDLVSENPPTGVYIPPALAQAPVAILTHQQAAALSGNTVVFGNIVLTMCHFLYVKLILCGALLLQDKEIELDQQVLTMIPYFVTQLVLHNLVPSWIRPTTSTQASSAIVTGRNMLKRRAVVFISTVLHILGPEERKTTRGNAAYTTYVRDMVAPFRAGSFFHLPYNAQHPYKFRNLQFRNAVMRLFYDSDNQCLAAKFPAAFVNGITIECIATFGAAIVHCVQHIEADKLGNTLPPFNSKVFYPIYVEFLAQLQQELDANNGFQQYLDEMSLEASRWLPLVGPRNAIYPIPVGDPVQPE